METVAKWSWRTYPAPLGADGVGSIPANPDAQNVPSFRRRRFEMKLSPFFFFCNWYIMAWQLQLPIKGPMEYSGASVVRQTDN